MLRRLTRTGLRRGLMGGSKPWLAVGAAAGAFRLLGRVAGKQPKVVYCEPLHPGETLIIRQEGPDTAS